MLPVTPRDGVFADIRV